MAVVSVRLRWLLGFTVLACALIAWVENTSEPTLVGSARLVKPAAIPRSGDALPGGAMAPITTEGSVQSVTWPDLAMQEEKHHWPALNEHTRLAWAPPPPPPPPPIQAVFVPLPTGVEEPPPPPFSYRWIGRLLLPDAPALALLGSDQASLAVSVDTVIDRQWKLQSIQAHQLVLVWLPTGQTVNLSENQ